MVMWCIHTDIAEAIDKIEAPEYRIEVCNLLYELKSFLAEHIKGFHKRIRMANPKIRNPENAIRIVEMLAGI